MGNPQFTESARDLHNALGYKDQNFPRWWIRQKKHLLEPNIHFVPIMVRNEFKGRKKQDYLLTQEAAGLIGLSSNKSTAKIAKKQLVNKIITVEQNLKDISAQQVLHQKLLLLSTGTYTDFEGKAVWNRVHKLLIKCNSSSNNLENESCAKAAARELARWLCKECKKAPIGKDLWKRREDMALLNGNKKRPTYMETARAAGCFDQVVILLLNYEIELELPRSPDYALPWD